jgi:signal transduction histidine kinase
VDEFAFEQARVMRVRLSLTVGLWFVCCGVVAIAERTYFPERARTVTVFYLIDALCSLLALVTVWRARAPQTPIRVATLLLAYLSARASWYALAVGNSRELLAMAHITVLGGLAVLLPWGWPAQLLVAATAVGTFALVEPHLPSSVQLLYTLVPLASAVGSTVLGAYFLDRYRHEAFERSRQRAEEADIARALVQVGETLSMHLDRPDLLERVNQLAVETVNSDWSGTWVLDEARRVFRLGACVGVPEALRAELARVEFPGDQSPVARALRPGVLVEVPDAAEQSLVPTYVVRRFEVASALVVPIARREEITGIVLHCYRRRTGPFTPRQRRLALGIAHAAAIALENARLIVDLQAANRLKSEFVSTMSHELRTPLNVITGYVDLLEDGAFGPISAPQHDAVERIRHSATELLTLITATLDLSRLEAGREVVTVGPVDLDQMFADLRAELVTLTAPGVALRWQNQVGRTWADGAKLKTILKNLAGNALKFTTAGSVEVTATAVSGRLTCTVRDTGIGIAADDLPNIFEMFRQVDSSAGRRFGGVGLGLHIVKHLVELLGGTVTVESAPGTGSLFTVELPLPLAAV